MLFHTPEFLVFFLVFLLCYLPFRGSRSGVWIIVVASQFFYAAWDFRYLPLLWGTMLTDFFVARGIATSESQSRRRFLLALSVGLNTAVLCFFKYWNLAAGSFGEWFLHDPSFLTIAGLALPIGVSFYTFQCLSYVFDVYRREQPPVRSLRDYAAFVTYFPQLVMGPIERARQLLPQILKPLPLSAHRMGSGMLLFAIGFFRKAAGDAMSAIADPVFSDLTGATPAMAVTALLCYWLQVYLDFSGYTDMARGVSRIMGIELSLNFRAPYFATSIQDFWRRWHITLSSWLKDYIYIPLGGSRMGKWLTVRNLYITMVLSACWHGGGWNFLIFGLLHGSYLTIASLFSRTSLSKSMNSPHRPMREACWRILGWVLTMAAFIYSLVYFRCETVHESMVLNARIGAWLMHPGALVLSPTVWLLLLPVFALEVWQYFGLDHENPDHESSLVAIASRSACFGLLLVFGIILYAGAPTEPFIYFQF